MKKIKDRKKFRRYRIRMRIRKNLLGTKERPRLSVYRSNNQIYAQLIDDLEGQTLVAASSREKEIASQEANKKEQAKMVGKTLAEKARKAGIETAVFDRGGYLYHGRVKSLADAAREGGLKF
ncbi:MAG: 50S ribosomal protein L18 [Bacteroidota bacterium]|nr:50S ribosomal protein L18 [Bacteroidota bacterium]